MDITYLGQAGFLFQINGINILIDPYLSNSVAKIQPHNNRRIPIDSRFFELQPNCIICTHSHADHLDIETLKHFINVNSNIVVLAPTNSWEKIRKFNGIHNNYILFNSGSSYSYKDILFYAVSTEHSDTHGIGIIISVDNKNYYITGDTMYNEKVFSSLPNLDFEAVFLPVNGYGNNMNFIDAERFIKRIRTKYIVPIHIGMFDNLNANDWSIDNKIIPQVYKKIIFK